MSAQRGKDLLLKIGDAGSPEAFTTIGGLRTRTLSLNARSVDVTHADSAGGWREILSGAGVRQASLSGAGVFFNNAVGESVRAAFFAGYSRNWVIVIPGFGALTGAFMISNLDYAGDYDGEATMSLALESAGELVFTPEAQS